MSGGSRRRDYRKLTTAGVACVAFLLAGLSLATPAMGQGTPPVFNNAPTIALPSACSTASTNIVYALGNVTNHAGGTVDLVMICGQNIVVVPGSGGGTFASTSAQSTTVTSFLGTVTQISLADVDGDGNLDLITTDENCSVDVFLGTGSGTFSSTAQKTMEPIYCGTAPELFVIADFNGDNKPDIALENTNNGTPSITVFLNTSVKGTVSFTANTVTVGSAEQQFSAMTVGNFTGHTSPAVPDLAVTVGKFASGIGFTDLVFVLQNNGAGTAFTALPSVTLPATTSTGTISALAAANLSSDGFLDVAAVDSGDGVIYVLNGHGTGNLSSCSSSGSTTTVAPCQTNNGQTITGLPLSFARNLFAGNFNGSPGLLFTGVNECISVLLSAPGGGLQTTPTNYVVGASTSSVVMADVNNDGFQDAIALASAGLSVFLNNTTGTLEGTQAFIAGSAPGEISLLQNFFGNGEMDLAVVPINAGITGSNAAVTVFGAPAGGPNGTFPQSSGPIPVPPGQSITAMTSGCVLVPVGSSPCTIPFVAYATYESAITMAFGFAFTTAKGGAASDIGSALSSQQITAIADGDFNGDGKTDLAFAIGSTNTILVFTGNGDGTFSKTPLTISLGTGMNPIALAVADFNADGMPDIAVLNQSKNTVGILLNNTTAGISGGLSFATMVPYPTGLSFPAGFTVGDFNGDGKPDIAVVSSNAIAVLLNQGGGVFPTTPPTPIALPASSSASAIATGDFNGDGFLDLAVTLPFSTDTVEILNGKGDGTFATGTATSWSVGANPAAMVVANFKGKNGDGLPDIAVADGDPEGNTVALLLNGSAAPPPNTSTFAQYSNIGPIQFGPVNVGTAFTQSLILTNTGSSPFMVNGFSLSNINPAFTITSVVCNNTNVPAPFSSPVTLAADGTCTINLQFLPTVNGNGQSELLTVATTTTNSNASAGPGGNGQAFLLVGDAVEPFANYSPAALNFGNVNLNTPTTQTVTVSNTGTGPLTLQLALIAPLGGGFSVTQVACNSVIEPSPTPFPITLNPGTPGGSCTFTVQFDPTTAEPLSGTLGFADNAGVGESNLTSTNINATTFQQSVPLSGTGVALVGLSPAVITDNEQVLVTDAPSFPDISDNETITVTDTASVTACQVVSISPGGTLPAATVGTLYTQQFSPAGLMWATSGNVPPGLTMNPSTGVLSGTPTGSGGTFNFTVTATSAIGCPVNSANASLTVNPAPTNMTRIVITGTSANDQNFILPTNVTLVGNTSPVTVEFTVQPGSGSVVLTGSVTVTEGSTPPVTCTTTITNGAGSCPLIVTGTVPSNTTLVATFTPDANSIGFLPSTSVPDTFQVVQATSCGTPPAPLTATQGATVTFTATTCVANDVTAPPTITVTACPPDAQCVPTITAVPNVKGVYTGTVTITVGGTGSSNFPSQVPLPRGGGWREPIFSFGVLLAILMAVQLARQNRTRPWLVYAAAFLMALLLGGLSGCGNSSSANGTPPNTYTVNVTITAGTSNVTVPLTLTVTK
jgi:FG-GAP-like repeat/Putative Ig domain/Abnormal spindle-like microcephaly-assoc'd, ASPM-SPD-2-Hydin